MEIRKAEKTDIDRIQQIYEAIHDAEEQGLAVIGWIRDVYPTRKTAEDALARGDLFVMTEAGRVVTAAEDAVMVLHALTVDPAEKGKGYGRAFVAFYEAYARDCGCTALRMDTNARNERARRLYQSLGYREAGIVRCVFNGIPGVALVCLEKGLKPVV